MKIEKKISWMLIETKIELEINDDNVLTRIEPFSQVLSLLIKNK
jgi:hypothetical protein